MLLSGQHILILEDEILIAMDLADIVRDAGAESVVSATTARAALQHIAEDSITSAILDVNLGEELSLAVALKLKEMKIPFIYHTGRTDILADTAWPEASVVTKPALASSLTEILSAATSA